MKDITGQAVEAFFEGRAFKKDNTEVKVANDGVVLFILHGGVISRRIGNRVEISTAQYDSVTTRERLNGILAYLRDSLSLIAPRVHRRKGLLHFGINHWDGDWIVADPGSDLEQLAHTPKGW